MDNFRGGISKKIDVFQVKRVKNRGVHAKK